MALCTCMSYVVFHYTYRTHWRWLLYICVFLYTSRPYSTGIRQWRCRILTKLKPPTPILTPLSKCIFSDSPSNVLCFNILLHSLKYQYLLITHQSPVTHCINNKAEITAISMYQEIGNVLLNRVVTSILIVQMFCATT